MTVNLVSEKVVTFAEVPRLGCIPRRRGDRRLHVSTIHRWHLRGIRGIHLEAIRVGGTLCTSVEAMQRFFERLAAPRVQNPSTIDIQTSHTEEQLDALGIVRPDTSNP